MIAAPTIYFNKTIEIIENDDPPFTPEFPERRGVIQFSRNGHIRKIEVDPAWRNKGIGSWLVRSAEQQMWSHTAYGTTYPSSNGFWIKNGYGIDSQQTFSKSLHHTNTNTNTKKDE